MSFDPIWVASRIRCDSPPESVVAERSSVRYSRPTSSMNCSRSLISFSTPRAISFSRSLIWPGSSSKKWSVCSTARRQTSAMLRPAMVTASDSGLRRVPLQAGHGFSERYFSSSFLR